MGDFEKRQQQEYETALQRCAAVAREECKNAQKGLTEAEMLVQELRRGMKAVRVDTKAGSTVQNAQTALVDLNRRLDGIVTEQLKSTRDSLATKKARLEKFTVTLFGRTMSGKSTIREALTHGDGGTIGKGNQRTTRDIREYEWNHLRIVDTPGIGAYEGKTDSEIAKSVIDESDILLFLVSSDSIQEASFRAMQDLRDQNKPVIFVLNVKHDLTQPVYRRRFLKSSYSVMGKEAVDGHKSRILKLASDELGMRLCKGDVIQVHAQAAFLATRPEYAAQSVALHRASGMDDLLEELTDEVLKRGPVRRLQTLLDGTIIQLIDLQESLLQEARIIRDNAELLEKKFGELNTRLGGYIDGVDERIERRVSEMLKPLRSSVSAFIDENIEREYIESCWESRVRSEKINEKVGEFQKTLCEEIRQHLEEFNRQTNIEYELLGKINIKGPRQYNPSNIKRNLRRVSAAATALASVAVRIAASNFWNPVGWVAGVLSVAAFGASWFLDDREKKLQLQKGKSAKQLRDNIDSEKLRLVHDLKSWFEKEITVKLVGSIRRETPTLYNGMFGISQELETAASSCARLQADLNRWLLLRCGQLVEARVAKDAVSAWIARDPGTQTKGIGTASSLFCQKVGKALGEKVEVQKPGPMQAMVVKALRPAIVDPMKISFDKDGAIVRLSQNQISRAKGRDGANLRLAESLLKTPIRLREDKGVKS